MPASPENVLDQFNALLNSPRRTWLFGAGISCDSGVPLMHPLTQRVRALLATSDGKAFTEIYFWLCFPVFFVLLNFPVQYKRGLYPFV